MMPPTLQIEDSTRYGLSVRTLFGLNLFRANAVELSAADDPLVILLEALRTENLCSAHVGSLALEGEEPENVFPPSSEQDYRLTLISLHGGTFYEIEKDSPAFFFPEAKQPLLGMKGEDFLYLLTSDALAVYVGAKEPTLVRMQSLLEEPFPGEAEWLQSLTAIYPLVVVTGGDGWHFVVYTKNALCFDLLASPLAKAREAIESTDWYQRHKSGLQWDDVDDLCLKLNHRPSSIRPIVGCTK